jgi:hypothetical protein
MFLKRPPRCLGRRPGNGDRCAEKIKEARANTGSIVAACGNLPAANTRYEAGLTSHRETRSFLSLCWIRANEAGGRCTLFLKTKKCFRQAALTHSP